jgi:hypothetical protein
VRDLRGLADIAIVGTACLEVSKQCGPGAYREFLRRLAGETI